MEELESRNGSNLSGEEAQRKAFKYAEALLGCDDAIEQYMTEPNGIYYRLVHNPLHPNDDIPQPLQQWKSLAQEQVKLPTQLPKNSTIEEQWEQVRNYSPSYNVSDKKLAAFFNEMLARRKNDRQRQKLLDKKGDTIIAVHLAPNDGVVQKVADENPEGHVVFLPFSDFKLAEHIDNTFEPRKLTDYKHEDENE